MNDFINLKNSYVATIQMGLMMNAGYEEAKRGNDIIHKFCENYIDNSNYSDFDKQNENYIDNSNYSDFDKQKMKHELELVKEALSQEIDRHFHRVG